jgi:hypothetical protein
MACQYHVKSVFWLGRFMKNPLTKVQFYKLDVQIRYFNPGSWIIIYFTDKMLPKKVVANKQKFLVTTFLCESHP